MENYIEKRERQRKRRVFRVRRKVRGTAERYRMSVFKSGKHISVQVIDDLNGSTIASAGTMQKNFDGERKKSKQSAKLIGQEVGKFAQAKGITKVVFDRGRYQFHGLVAELANGAREAGLLF